MWGVTAELTLRYRKPLPLTGEVRAVGRITRDTRRLFEGSGEICSRTASVAVEATGKYLKMALGEITDDDFDQREWFADPRASGRDQIDVVEARPPRGGRRGRGYRRAPTRAISRRLRHLRRQRLREIVGLCAR